MNSGSGKAPEAPRIAWVTCDPDRRMADDDRLAAAALERHGIEVESAAWDDPAANWDRFDRVVIRSVGDYAGRLEEFLGWCDQVGAARLRNRPELVRWNSDKRYLAELDGSGLPVPPTLLVAPLGPVPDLHGEVVVKPVIGSGSGETGRFRPEERAGMLELLERLGRRGAVAMLQPYLHESEEVGETGLVFFGGEFAYARKKHAVLRPDVAGSIENGPGSARTDADETLVPPGETDAAELELGRRTTDWITGKFGRIPLYLRVDTLLTEQGPVVMEVDAIEPHLHPGEATGSESPADLFAEAVRRDLESG